ncbi:MAG: hypothetical protein IJ202_07535 [Bacteroidales bacterium]|nr:hypothetical protein [Bacteroidales bacterium]
MKETKPVKESVTEEKVPLPGHDEIVLGKKVDDPYSLANMQRAMSSLGFDKTLSPTHEYVRFLPSCAEDLSALIGLGVPLFDHPLDHEIGTEGDYYHDPSLSESFYTWLYAVLEKGTPLPENIRHELLHECFISPEMKASGKDTPSWEALLRESYRLTGNYLSESGHPKMKGGSLVVDGTLTSGDDMPLAGIRVVMNSFTMVDSDITDGEGRFTSVSPFVGSVRFRIDFTDGGWSVGMSESSNLFSSHSIGSGTLPLSEETISSWSDGRTAARAAAALALRDYSSLTEREGISQVQLPDDFVLRFLSGLDAEGTALLSSRGVSFPGTVLSGYLGGNGYEVDAFRADAVMGKVDRGDFAGTYIEISRMLADAGLCGKIGLSSWGRSISGRLSARLWGGNVSDYGRSDEVVRMWSDLVAGIMYEERFGRQYPVSEGDHMELLPGLYTGGETLSEILSLITWKTATADDLLPVL